VKGTVCDVVSIYMNMCAIDCYVLCLYARRTWSQRRELDDAEARERRRRRCGSGHSSAVVTVRIPRIELPGL